MFEKTLKVSRLLELYGGLLTDNQREVMDLYYNCDMSLAEVGEELGVSRQGVRDTIIRASKILSTTEEKVGYLARLSDIKTCLEHMVKQDDGDIKNSVMKLADSIEV